jgi:hypothetical protein
MAAVILLLAPAALPAAAPATRDTPQSLSVEIQAALSADQVLQARYLLAKLASRFPGSPELYASALVVADYCYGSGARAAALECYRTAFQDLENAATAPGSDRALLRAAELSLYHARDREMARGYFRRVRRGALPPEEAPGYRTLSARLNWDVLSPSVLGLQDGNVSALLADGDDLWVATWNGGVSRYSLSSGTAAPFPSPASTARCLQADERRIWVGTFEGLSAYSRLTGRWSTVDRFREPEALKVQALVKAGDELYAGTLGDGLFRLRDGVWEEVSHGPYPGRFITCLALDAAGRLLIGTMTLGLVVLDRGTGMMRPVEGEHPEFTAANVTAVLSDSGGRVWIGTYGDGLYLWDGGRTPMRSYTSGTGEIADDWVLAACETPRGVYFGTFGGGVSVISARTGTWRRIGIGDGLASRDVTSIAFRAPYLFFGTLGAGVSRYDEGDDGAEF